jgi:hypothetical protein
MQFKQLLYDCINLFYNFKEELINFIFPSRNFHGFNLLLYALLIACTQCNQVYVYSFPSSAVKIFPVFIKLSSSSPSSQNPIVGT